MPPNIKLVDLFAKSKHCSREMLWDVGLREVTIAGSELQDAFLPGRNKGEKAPVVLFRESWMRGVVLNAGRRNFLLKRFGTPNKWPGNRIGVYVDKDMRTQHGMGSISFAVGPDFWTEGNYSGHNPPPPLEGAKQSRPRQSEPSADEPAPDSTPPEAVEPYMEDSDNG